MTLPVTYPPADQTAQPRPKLAGGATFDHVEKLCLHTTETSGWPGYPTFAPQLTYNPWTHAWRQHFTLRRSATTLADPSSTRLQENRDSVIQVEIVGYCDPKYNVPGKGVDFIDDQAVRDLADFAAWLHEHGGLELQLAPTWLRYPASYGRSKARMSEAEFDAFRGIHGHEHASGNDHGDPGAPPWLATFLRYAQQAAGQTSTPTAPTTGKGLPMADATDIYVNYRGQQKLAAGDNEIKINEKGDKTLFSGPNDGVDVLATVDVRDASGRPYYGRVAYNPAYPADPAAQATTNEPQFLLVDRVEAFFRVVSYKDGTPTTTISSRRPTTSDQVSWKGSVAKDPTAGRSARVRLVVSVPKGAPSGLTLDSVQVSGWKL